MRTAALVVLPFVVGACSGSKPTASSTPVTAPQPSAQAENRAALPVDSAPASSAAPAIAPSQHGRVVAQLQFRDHVLVIRAGAGELRYDVQTRAGLLIAGALTMPELNRQFPAVAEQFRDSTAVVLDASLHREPAENRAPRH